MTERLRAALQELVPLVAFINGEAPLDGVWFGDVHPNERGMFWWRNRLPSAAELRAALASQDMEQRADEAHSCSYFCDRPTCVKAQRDDLRERLEQRAGFVMVPPKDSEQLRLAVRAVKQTLFSGGSSVALPADSWIERAFIAGMLAAAPPIEALEGGKTDLWASGPVHQDTSSTPAPDSDRRTELLAWCYSKLHYRSFDNMEDALVLDEIKLLLEHGV